VKPALVAVADDVWAAETRLAFLGLPITSRMTVVRLPTGLWLHSPVPLDPIKQELDGLGAVAWRVAPNLMHHLYQGPYQQAYPASRLAAPPALAKKRSDLRIDAALSDPPPSQWSDRIDARTILGNAILDETVFLHRASKSLIITDLAVHMGPWDHWAVRLYARLNRCYGRLAVSFALKSMFKDRDAARASIEAILEWDFDRVIPAHGPIIETGGKQALRAAFDWLLRR